MNNQQIIYSEADKSENNELGEGCHNSELFSEGNMFSGVTPGLKLVLDVSQNPKIAYLGKVTKVNDGTEHWYAFNNSQFSFVD